ncbi:MAG: MerR family transcriptional regulator [Chitinophagaceae bacterium]
MNSFTISQLQQFSGIKAHTIRIWEQRYNALQPNRSNGNTRYYDNSQLRRLLNIVSLLQYNYKVSELCSMPDEKLFILLEQHLKTIQIENEAETYFVSQLIAGAMGYDEAHFEKIFSTCLLRFGLKDTYTKVIYPMLLRIGLLWTNGSIPPAQEHFISNLLRQKIFSAIDSLPPAKPVKDTWLLFLPENEFHEIGLLFAQYIIRLSGKKVIYLGANVPLDSLKMAVTDVSPTHLFFFLVHHNMTAHSQKYLDILGKSFRNIKIHIAGNPKLISQLKAGKGIEWIQSVAELEKQLA